MFGDDLMNEKRIFLSSPTMNGTEMDYINRAFADNKIIPMGPNVTEFEERLSGYVGKKYAVGLCSGTAAIHMALKIAGAKPQDVVFCQSLTFAATANPIMYENCVPVFIDSEADTWNMCPKALEKAFEKYPECKFVMLVHLFGNPAKIDEIKKICEEHGATLIEDAAEALGARYKGRAVGCDGDYSIVSFNGNKIITTSGGGMFLTDSEEDAKKVLFWSTQARDAAPWYQHSELGYNYRMSNVTAGIGCGQMNTLDEYVIKKRRIFDIYKSELEGVANMTFQPCEEHSYPSRWLSAAVSDMDFMKIVNSLAELNIESRPVWKPMHMQPYYEKYDSISADDKGFVCENLFKRGICLPSDIKNTDEDMEKIISCIKRICK